MPSKTQVVIDGGNADNLVIGSNSPAAGFFTNISSGANTVFVVDGVPDPLLGSITDVAIDKNSGDLYVKETVVTTTTWNPLDKSDIITLSNGNLTAISTTGFDECAVRSIAGLSHGKCYWEATFNGMMNLLTINGIGTIDADINRVPGIDIHAYGYFFDGHKQHNNSITLYGDEYSDGDIISTALDMDNKKIWWAKNAYNNLNGTFHCMVCPGIATDSQITANFGGSPFAYPVPAGFFAGLGESVLLWVKKINVGATIKHRTYQGPADYNPSILTDDNLIVVDNSNDPRNVIISTEDVQSGSLDYPRFFLIKDEYQEAHHNNITISLESGTIDGSSNIEIKKDGESVTLYVTGVNGFVVN